MILSKLEKIIFFLCLLFLPTQLGRHFFTDSSFVFSLPVDYLAFVIYFWDILSVCLFLIFVFQIIFIKIPKKINYQASNIFLLFIFLQILSLINSLNPLAGIFRLEQYFTTGLFGLYLSSQNLERIKNILTASLSAGLIFEMALSIFQTLFGKTSGFWIFGERSFTVNTPGIARFDWFGSVFLRAYGTFPHPNVLAGYSLIVLGIIFGFSKKAVLLIPPVAILIFLSFSRIALAVFILESLVLFKDLIKRRYKFLLIIIFLTTPLLLIRFLSVFNFDLISLIRRKELNDIAIQAFLNNSFFGVGLNSFINFVASSNLISGEVRFLQPVHNIFLLSLAETGIIGTIGLFMLLIPPVYFCFRRRQETLAFAFLICWIGVFILGNFDHYFLTLPQGQRLLFLLWGLSLAKLNSRSLVCRKCRP